MHIDNGGGGVWLGVMSPGRDIVITVMLGDKGREWGSKNWIFGVTSFMDGPLPNSATDITPRYTANSNPLLIYFHSQIEFKNLANFS